MSPRVIRALRPSRRCVKLWDSSSPRKPVMNFDLNDSVGCRGPPPGWRAGKGLQEGGIPAAPAASHASHTPHSAALNLHLLARSLWAAGGRRRVVALLGHRLCGGD